ncbi:MAG: hypothetical protein Q8L81_00775 [Bacteroidota bacterium]|nr:hypothetical protein [Bacteroidota bacterium]
MKALSEIDNVYGSMFHKMSIRERISYCELLIRSTKTDQKNKNIYQNNKERTNDLLIAAQAELEFLTDNDQKNINKKTD